MPIQTSLANLLINCLRAEIVIFQSTQKGIQDQIQNEDYHISIKEMSPQRKIYKHFEKSSHIIIETTTQQKTTKYLP